MWLDKARIYSYDWFGFPVSVEFRGLRNSPLGNSVRCASLKLRCKRIASRLGREVAGYTTGCMPKDPRAHLITMRFLTSRPPDIMAVFTHLGQPDLIPMWGGCVRHTLKTREVRKKV